MGGPHPLRQGFGEAVLRPAACGQRAWTRWFLATLGLTGGLHRGARLGGLLLCGGELDESETVLSRRSRRWIPHTPSEQQALWARGFARDLAMLKPNLRASMVRSFLCAVVTSSRMGAEDVGCVLG